MISDDHLVSTVDHKRILGSTGRRNSGDDKLGEISMDSEQEII